MITLRQNLQIMNNSGRLLRTQHPFFTTDNNGFNMRSVGQYYYTEVEECPEDAIYDAFNPVWDYFKVVDDNTIIFETQTSSCCPSWAHLIKIRS